MEKLKQKKLNEIQTDYNEIGSYIMEKLCLRKFPSLVECFDISHIQGTNTVASMVVFENGIKKKSAYRKFKIKTVVDKPDDFASMSEVVQRRYSKLLKNNEKFPDKHTFYGRLATQITMKSYCKTMRFITNLLEKI